MNPKLVELRNRYEQKAKLFQTVVNEAGADHDFEKITTLKGTTAEKTAALKTMNDELEVLGAEIQELVDQENLAKKNKGFQDNLKSLNLIPSKTREETPEGRPLFKSFGEFTAMAVAKDAFLQMKDMGIDIGEAGGYAIPDEVSTNILMVDPKLQIVRPRARVLPPGTNPEAKFELPVLRQGGVGVYGGVTFLQAAEGTQGTKSDPKLDLVTLEPRRFSGYVAVGNSLLRNAPAFSSFIEALFREAKAGYEEFQFVSNGNGGGLPISFLNSLCAINVPRNTAATIKFADVLGMIAKMYGENPIWLAHKSAIPALVGLSDALGFSIFIQGNATAGIPATLMGYPIYFTWKQPLLGTRGDLMMVDPTYYLIKDGSGPFIAASDQVFFREDQTVVKMTWFLDGQSWVKAPIVMDDGVSTASPIVVLQ